MSGKMLQDEFLKKLKIAYPNNSISIIEWNGYTRSIKFYCDICEKEHTSPDARLLLNKKTYCQVDAATNQRWELNEYRRRLEALHQEKINILAYSGLSNPVEYECPRCKQKKEVSPARILLTRLSLCDACYGAEKNIVFKKIQCLFNNSKDYQLIAWRGVKNKLTQKCLKCGSVYDRYPANVLNIFDTCPNCNNGAKKQLLLIDEIQKRVDNTFGEKKYLILEYQGQLQKHNKIKCLECGLIFESQMTSFLSSRGCPKCKRFKSKGEQKVQKFLKENNIVFESQKRFKDCNNGLSSFDFCAYKDGQMYLIEVNGIQHYEQTARLGDLSDIQRRDNLKIQYCKDNNIPLIIIPYSELVDSDIDNKLSFLKGSTTTSNEGKE